jgi:outer membrane immunogenic protein
VSQGTLGPPYRAVLIPPSCKKTSLSVLKPARAPFGLELFGRGINVWRLRALGGLRVRVLARPASLWPIGLCMALVLIPLSQRALAQSSLGAPLNNATAQSLLDAVRQNEKDLIDREILGNSPGGQGATGSGGTGSLGLNTFSTGRLRSSDHDALSVPPGGDPGNGPFPYRTSEVSAFSNVVVSVPGIVLGGQLKLSGFVGSNAVYLQLKSDSLNILDPDQDGRARNESMIFGGTALWSKQNTYALATIVGTVGQSTLKDSVDDCYKASDSYPADFCHHNRYSFNTAGFIGTLTAGQVFDLAGKSGPKLDVRGSIGYTHNVGDTFSNVFTDTQRYTLSTFTGTGGVTLFTNMVLQDKSLLRPYIQGYVRQEWGYDNKLNFNIVGSGPGTVQYDQAHLYGGVDGGVAYVQGNTTLGASIYYEGSGSERTLGGRLGVSQKLDNIDLKSKTPNWSGFYVGLNAGGAWGHSHIGTSVACLDNDGDKIFNCPFLTPPEAPGATTGPAVSAAGTGTLSDGAFTAGVQAGFNLQAAGLVFGLEADTQSFRLGASQSVTVPGLATVVTSFDTDWLFTARSRVGLPIAPSLLVYATTGFALTDLSVSNSVTTIGAASQRGLVTGKVFGAGAEWALSRNWTLRGEYLFLDFGNVSVNAPTVQPASDYNTARTTADLTAQVVRMGLNYKF